MGKYNVKGTPSYLDPLLFREYKLHRHDEDFFERLVHLDVFKTDIFSLGVTMLEIAAGKRFRHANRSEKRQGYIY